MKKRLTILHSRPKPIPDELIYRIVYRDSTGTITTYTSEDMKEITKRLPATGWIFQRRRNGARHHWFAYYSERTTGLYKWRVCAEARYWFKDLWAADSFRKQFNIVDQPEQFPFGPNVKL